jgi:Uma2 family endonuclease
MTAALSLPDRREWTVDDLAGLSNDFRYELVNGRLLVTSPIGPHQDLCVEVLLALRPNCPLGFAAFHELSLLIDRRNQPRPDVAAMRLDHIDRTPAPAEDAVLVVEIISKENTLKEIREKQRVYARAGVPRYWVVNPLHGPVTLTELVLNPDRQDYHARIATSGVFETDQPWPVRLDLPTVTRRYEQLLAGARGVRASQ